MIIAFKILEFAVVAVHNGATFPSLDSFQFPIEGYISPGDIMFVIKLLPYFLMHTGFSMELSLASALAFKEVFRYFVLQNANPDQTQVRRALRNAIFQAWRVSMAFDWALLDQ